MTKLKKTQNKKEQSVFSHSPFTIHHSQPRGFTLFYAMLISSLLLAVGLAVLNITFKEFVLSSGARDSETAFYAADSALECALYWDYREKPFGFYGDSLASGLTGYWRFEETDEQQGDDIVVDSSGNNRHGTATGDPTWVSGTIGNALSFDGTDDAVDLVDDYIPLTGDFTITLWHQGVPDDSPRMITGGSASDSPSYGRKFGFLQSSKEPERPFQYFVRIVDETQASFAPAPDASSGWNFVALRRDDGVVSITVGEKGPQTLFGGAPQEGEFPITGWGYALNQNGQTQRLQGNLDDVRVYNRALSDDEIRDLKNGDTRAEFVEPIGTGEAGENFLMCAGDDINDGKGWWDDGSETTGWRTERISEQGDPEKWMTTFDIQLPNNTCAVVTVIKGDNMPTEIISRGYSTCDLDNPRTLERAIRAQYF